MPGRARGGKRLVAAQLDATEMMHQRAAGALTEVDFAEWIRRRTVTR